jgi:hypothetical protein
MQVAVASSQSRPAQQTSPPPCAATPQRSPAPAQATTASQMLFSLQTRPAQQVPTVQAPPALPQASPSQTLLVQLLLQQLASMTQENPAATQAGPQVPFVHAWGESWQQSSSSVQASPASPQGGLDWQMPDWHVSSTLQQEPSPTQLSPWRLQVLVQVSPR